jgi:hypothetical protein
MDWVLNFQILITYTDYWNFIQVGYQSFKTLNTFMIIKKTEKKLKILIFLINPLTYPP